jgi:sigma-54 dependent transcriptional regulator, acetoin dehydrogenase operon transcriptional activator AcoR
MKDTLPTSEPQAELEKPTASLVVVVQADDLSAGASRHVLRDVTSVAVGRGDERVAQRSASGGAHALELLLPDSRLSRQHARIESKGERWVLRDAGSRNGSLVNGERVDQRILEPGDLIELGGSFLLYAEHRTFSYLERDSRLAPSELGAFSTLNPRLKAQFQLAEQGAHSMIPVLVRGETGTGKEVCARAIHALSGRSGPFVAVNCGALPATLVESQLFGFVKGAFTGADRSEPGFVRAAEGGTLLLDEIGDLPATSQVALLRVLQNSEVTPVGSSSTHRVDVRFISATHQPLEQLLESGKFRRDLLARLTGFEIVLPALRERREDLGVLIAAILSRHGVSALRGSTARALLSYTWPDNIRELERCLSSASVLAGSEPIALEHLPQRIQRSSPSSLPPEAESEDELSPDDQELRDRVIEALRDSGGNLSEAARRMGKARQQLQRWVKRFGLDPAAFVAPSA